MKKRNGFTLVELLGVIVVLAILALITIPIISNVVNNVRIKSLESSAYGLVEAGNLYYAQYGINSNTRFDIENNQISSTDTDNLIKYKGSVKSGVVILNKKGNVTVCVTDGKNSAYKNYNETQVTTKKGQTCSIDINSYIVKLSEEGDTLTELSGEQLTSEIQDLKDEITSLKEIINNKADKTELATKASTSDLNALNTSLSASISQLSSDIADVDDKIYTPVRISSASNFTSSTDWMYTGISLSIPAHSYYSLTAYATYNNAQALGVAVSTSSSSLIYLQCSNIDNIANNGRKKCTFSGSNESSAETFYLWAKYGGNNANSGGISGFYLQKQ